MTPGIAVSLPVTKRKRPRPRFESWDARRTALPQNCSRGS